MTSEAHREAARKVGQANKGRKRPDNAERMKARIEKGRAMKADAERIKETNLKKPIYTNPVLLAYRLARFMRQCELTEWENSSGKHIGKPYTIAGGKVATGLEKQWEDYKNGKSDHVIHSDLIQVAREGVQLFKLKDAEPEYLQYTLCLLGNPDGYMTDVSSVDLEEAHEQGMQAYFSEIIQRFCLIVEAQREEDLYVKGRTSDIFIHKSQYGWKDDTIIVNRREMIPSAEARTMLEEILNLPEVGE